MGRMKRKPREKRKPDRIELRKKIMKLTHISADTKVGRAECGYFSKVQMLELYLFLKDQEDRLTNNIPE